MTRFTKFFIILFSLSYSGFSVSHGQGIVLDPSSVGTSFLRASDGSNPFGSIDVINIAVPSSGVSLNRYDRFDVGIEDGVYLNNLTSSGVSRAGLAVTANPHLVSGPASMIVNEVTGSSSSTLRGFVEVVGSPADILVSNPHGVTCDGCSFVNSSHVALSSGSVSFDSLSGSLDLNIHGGSVIIGAGGMLSSSHDGVYLAGKNVVVDGSIDLDGFSDADNRVNIYASVNRVSMTDSDDPDYSDFGRWDPTLHNLLVFGARPRSEYSIDVSYGARVSADIISFETQDLRYGVRILGDLVTNDSIVREIYVPSDGSGSSSDAGSTPDASFPEDFFVVLVDDESSSPDGDVSPDNMVSISSQSNVLVGPTGLINSKNVNIDVSSTRLDVSGMIFGNELVELWSNGFGVSDTGVVDSDADAVIVSSGGDIEVSGIFRASDKTYLVNFGGHLELGPESNVAASTGRVALYAAGGIDVRGEVLAQGNLFVFGGTQVGEPFYSPHLTVHPGAIMRSYSGKIDAHTDGLIEVHRGGSVSSHSDHRLTLHSHKSGDIVISGEVNGYGLIELINDSGSLDVRTGGIVGSSRGTVKGYGSSGIIVGGSVWSHDDIDFSHLVHRDIRQNPISTGLSPSLVVNSGGSLTSQHGDINADISGTILLLSDSSVISEGSTVTLRSSGIGDISILGRISGWDHALVVNDSGSIIVAGDVEVSSSGSLRIDGPSHRASGESDSDSDVDSDSDSDIDS